VLALAMAVASWGLCAWAQGAGKAPDALKAVTAEKYPGVDAVIVADETRVDVEESGLSHVNKTQLVKVLTEAGAAQYATMRFDYDPASSFAEVNGMTVYRSAGAVEAVPQDRVFDLPQPQQAIYWGPRMKVASVPKLQPGDAVEIKTYSKGFVIAYLGNGGEDEKYIPPMRGHYYDVVLFQGDRPMVKKSYTISLPKDKPIRARVFHGELASSTDFDDKTLTYTWSKENIPAIEREARMVEDTDAMTKLVLATVQTWPEKSRWFYHVNEDVNTFAYNDAIKAKTDEITRGLKTDDEKRKALLAWVARQIRYSGISMGKGEGYTLHPGIMDFNDRAGVCKDIAGMLITMFRAAGYEHTYPAMTMAGAVVENLPADQFNHCVVATEIAPNQYKLYDPTWCPFSAEVWSSAERPQNYVIGTPRGEELMETPAALASENFINLVSDGALAENGDLSGTFVITGGAYSETNLRWSVVNSPAWTVRSTFEQWLTALSPRAELVSYETTDPVNVDLPFKITLKYTVPGYALVHGDRMAFTPPSARNILSNRRLTDFVGAVTGKERKRDIFLRATREFNYQETVRLPKGYRLNQAPEAKAVEGPAADWSARLAMKGDSLVLSERLAVKKKIIPAADYGNLKEAVDAMKAYGEALAVVERGAGSRELGGKP
jgi:transglutaminase-like putative cysteine protease